MRPVDDEGGHGHAFHNPFGGLLFLEDFRFALLVFGNILDDAFVAGDTAGLIAPDDAGEQGGHQPAPGPGQAQFQVPDKALVLHLHLKALPIPGVIEGLPQVAEVFLLVGVDLVLQLGQALVCVAR